MGSTPGEVGQYDPRDRRARPARAQKAARFRWSSTSRRTREWQGASSDAVGKRASDGCHRGGGILVAQLQRRSRQRDGEDSGEVRGLLLGSGGGTSLAGW